MEVVDYPNYLIYDDGRVYSKYRNRFINPRMEKNGYLKIDLCQNKKHKTFRIHRLVALHYIPLVEDKDIVDHIDRNRTNNHFSNLRWCNSSENAINTGVHKDNKLGIKNISFDKHKNNYVFDIMRKGKRHRKTFKTLDECIEYKDNYLLR